MMPVIHLSKLVFGVVVLTLLSGRATSTSLVVAFLRNDGTETVVLAADSLVVSPPARPRTECKILKDRNCFFMTSGLTAYRPTDFGADDLALQACREAGRPGHKAQKFTELATAKLSAAVVHARKFTPLALEPYRENKNPILTVTFSIVGDGSPGFAIIKYRLGSGSGGKVILEPIVDLDDMSDSSGVFANPKVMDRFFLRNPTWRERFGLADVARELIKMDANDRPGEVGLPISIVVIQNGGARWLNRGVCVAGTTP